MIDAADIDAIRANPTRIVDVFTREAKQAMQVKRIEIKRAARFRRAILQHAGQCGAHSSGSRMHMNASWGMATLPTVFIRFFPSFCFSSSFRLRVTSPP